MSHVRDLVWFSSGQVQSDQGDHSVHIPELKHTITLFSLSDHYILSPECRVIVDQVDTNYHGMPIVFFFISHGCLT